MPPPTLVINPISDEEFAWRVRDVVGEGVVSPGALEDALRDRYPRVVVRERGLQAEAPTWYVYREGTWVRSSD